jgi:hypothetical protein
LIDKNNPIIENYDPPSPLKISPSQSKAFLVQEDKKGKNFLI